MAWLIIKEWKKILKKISMLWYVKKRVLMLMLIRKQSIIQRLVLNVEICQMNVPNLRKHRIKTHYEFSL